MKKGPEKKKKRKRNEGDSRKMVKHKANKRYLGLCP
jgi:hypothetical protein